MQRSMACQLRYLSHNNRPFALRTAKGPCRILVVLLPSWSVLLYEDQPASHKQTNWTSNQYSNRTLSLRYSSASPGERRHYLRESEDIDDEMTIEAYLYRSDEYRNSSFATSLPLP